MRLINFKSPFKGVFEATELFRDCENVGKQIIIRYDKAKSKRHLDIFP